MCFWHVSSEVEHFANGYAKRNFNQEISMVLALVKLHNFCINVLDDVADVPMNLAAVEQNIATNESGSVSLVQDEEAGVSTPQGLIGGGHHFDDAPRAAWHQCGQNTLHDPCPFLLLHVVAANMMRPRHRIV